MKKHTYLLGLLGIMVALAMTTGCYIIEIPQVSVPPSITQEPTVPGGATSLPVIISFTASSTSIIAGQPVTLSWETSGATSVTISPDVGTVSSNGTLQVSPNIQTTYTLVASNGTASVFSSITVGVTPAIPLPDLVITNMWTTGKRVYYVVKNEGEGKSGLNEAHLYVNGYHVAFSFIQPLDPGQERVEVFEAYVAPFDVWPYSNLYAYPYPYHYPYHSHYPYPYVYPYRDPPRWNVKVCADVENTVLESYEGNNCMEQVWGETWGNKPSYVK